LSATALNARGGMSWSSVRVGRDAAFGNLRSYALAGIALCQVLTPTHALAIEKKGVDFEGHTAIERPIIDYNSVDVFSGRYDRTDVHLTIGDPANGGLQWLYNLHTGDAEVRDAYNGKITLENSISIDSGKTKVSVASGADSFKKTNSASGACTTTCKNVLGRGSTLVKTGTVYIYTDSNGDIYNFDAFTGNVNPPYTGTIARLTSIQKANGVVISIAYDEYGSCTPKSVGCPDRIKSIISNAGYALKYEYGTGNFRQVTKVSAVNLTTGSCTLSPLNCATYDSSVDISYPFVSGKNVLDVTRSGGKTYRYGIWSTGYYEVDTLNYVRMPSGTEINVAYDVYFRTTSYATAAGTWTYAYSDTNLDLINSADGRQTFVTNPDNSNRSYSFRKGAQLPTSETDEFGKTTTYLMTQLTGGQVAIGTVQKPEGNKSVYTYDARGNILAETIMPKSGSGLSSKATTAGFDTTCANLKTCNKPNWTKDFNNNQTDYTYSSVHGGLLTLTLPADSNGLRQRTYNTYTAFNTGSGDIHRLTRTETCGLTSGQLSLTSCPATSGTSVTVTGYGDSSTAPKTYKTFLPYQVTKTDGAGSLSETTTYAYDNVGNFVSVDGPRADVDDKVYKTYDGNRKAVCEIGIDPDGGGGLIRTMVRHTYNLDDLETLTETGTGTSTTDCTPGSAMTVSSFERVTYDVLGRAIKTEVGQP
jgi:hypothetical protein